MTNVTLSVNDVVFTFQDGDVETCKEKIISTIENSLITGTGPNGAYNYDYEGSGKTLELSGVLTPSETDRTSVGTCKTILAQKQWLESLISGQQNTINFVSKYGSNSVETFFGAVSPYQGDFDETQCKVDSISFEEEKGNPEQLMFRMSFSVGADILITPNSFILMEISDFVLIETGDKIIL